MSMLQKEPISAKDSTLPEDKLSNTPSDSKDYSSQSFLHSFVQTIKDVFSDKIKIFHSITDLVDQI